MNEQTGAIPINLEEVEMSLKEKFYRWLSYKLPKELVYFASIRMWARATTGEYSSDDATTITMSDAIKAWEKNG
jgi:predicted AAA+ superfamily ATPase